jgi:hypothetical protein
MLFPSWLATAGAVAGYLWGVDLGAADSCLLLPDVGSLCKLEYCWTDLYLFWLYLVLYRTAVVAGTAVWSLLHLVLAG